MQRAQPRGRRPILCQATDHIAEQIAFIADIEAKGFTYRTVRRRLLRHVEASPTTASSRASTSQGLEAGARVDLGEKRNPTDFALWKFSPAGRAAADGVGQPVGRGLPRLAHRVLGDGAEVPRRLVRHPLRRRGPHPGPPHQRDRADRGAASARGSRTSGCTASSCCSNDAKMAKSAGEFLRVAVAGGRAATIRSPTATSASPAHYRSQLNFTWEALDAAADRARPHAPRLPRAAQRRGRAAGRGARRALRRRRSTTTSTCRARWPSRGRRCAASLRRRCKRATLAKFDEVLGLGLADWTPRQVEVPADVLGAGRGARGGAQGEAVGGGRPAARRAGRGRDGTWKTAPTATRSSAGSPRRSGRPRASRRTRGGR